MSYSASAILFYGLSFTQDYDKNENEIGVLPWQVKDEKGESIYDNDFDSWYVEKFSDIVYPDAPRENKKIWDEYFRQFVLFLKEVPVDIELSGYEYSNTCIAAKGSVHSSDYETRKISSEFLVVDPDWDNQIKKFCEKCGIPYTQPSWCLSAGYS